LCGDVGDTVRALLPMVESRGDRMFLDHMLEHHRGAEKDAARVC
jgi:uncharacterized protein (DUF305 family)